MAHFVVRLLAQALGANVHDKQEALGKIAVFLLCAVLAVVLPFPLAILRAAAILDVRGHAPFTGLSGLCGIICALVVFPLLGLEPIRQFDTAGSVIGALLGLALGLSLWRLAPTQSRADPITVERHPITARAIDMARRLVRCLSAMSAFKLHVRLPFLSASVASGSCLPRLRPGGDLRWLMADNGVKKRNWQ